MLNIFSHVDIESVHGEQTRPFVSASPQAGDESLGKGAAIGRRGRFVSQATVLGRVAHAPLRTVAIVDQVTKRQRAQRCDREFVATAIKEKKNFIEALIA
ncbi:hypothetical protein CHU93_02075 [Sandarakinorhabdus cyanobacteriorum]|uniref:Uncharacterized protein n=1 Tax=Sandarakinorhabdus cyanobacteriorum TaxID=1981098 RepID=A0A255YZW4_9SPHN|nr:hypothetical protein CHU93_02075 [Sandarakinorhabdus cyanobacteriorum]